MTNGIKQSCVLALTMFSMMFSTTGLAIRYGFDCKLFSLRRLQAKCKMQTYVLDELHYADGMAKNVSTERKMQEAMDRVS